MNESRALQDKWVLITGASKGLGIRIINVCPGKMATELFRAAGRDMDTSAFLSPREVAEGVLYMLAMSDRCSHAELSVDRMS
jgi:short-subunit dehydrogenase